RLHQLRSRLQPPTRSSSVPALFRPWAPMVADLARIKAGDRVLDIACRTGVLAREAAARTGQKSHVAGLDPRADFLDRRYCAEDAGGNHWRHDAGPGVAAS